VVQQDAVQQQQHIPTSEPNVSTQPTGTPTQDAAVDSDKQSHQAPLNKLVNRLTSHLQTPFTFHTGNLLPIFHTPTLKY
jgi:hypothetical protein